MPFLVAEGDSVAVVFDPNNAYWFDEVDGHYTSRYGVTGATLAVDPDTQTFTFTRTQAAGSEITLFNDFSVDPAPGGFLNQTDSRGILINASWSSDGFIDSLQRTFSSGSSTVTETLAYEYFTDGPASGQLQTVTLQRQVGTDSPTAINQVSYTYYGTSDTDGSQNDLQTAIQQLPDNAGGWSTVAIDYYRYYLGTEVTGTIHGIKLHAGPEACRQMFNDGVDWYTADDEILGSYADEYFEYDPTSRAVTKRSAAICSTCPVGGATSAIYSYTANPRDPEPGYNVWSMRTQQTLADESQIITYTNYAGTTMLSVTVDPGGLNSWSTFYRYDNDGHLIWNAQPSAVSGYDDSSDDLLALDSTTGLYQYLRNTTGLINVTNYYSSTNISSGAVLGYVQSVAIRAGQSGSDVIIRSYTYTSNIDSSGNIIYPVLTDTSYPDANDLSKTIVTSYSYVYYSGTNQRQQVTTTLPVVSTDQNGSGVATTTIQQYDVYGNLLQKTDERGIVSTYVYGGRNLGAVTQQILNFQSGVTESGVNVTTDFTYDDQGRQAQVLGPNHTVSLSGAATTVRKAIWNAYLQSAQPASGPWSSDQTWTGTGFATGSGLDYTYTLVDPVSLSFADKAGRITDQITSRRTTGSGALATANTFEQSDWQNWSSTQHDGLGHVVSARVYFQIPSSGLGDVGVNYSETVYGYDALERQNLVISPVGTITRTVWTTPNRVASTWIGTNDFDSTESDPTGGAAAGNNMVQINAMHYDGDSAGGDGNLTQVAQYATATNVRTTTFGYDFRNRRTSMTDAVSRYTAYTYDNLDRQTQVQAYATSGGNLYAQSQANFDNRSRIYQTINYAVDPSTGTVGNALISNTWFDPSGNVLQQIQQGDGQAFSKNAYNGMNWTTASYRGYSTSGTSYTQAGTVIGDIIVSQSIPTFNEVGSVISTAVYDRLNDASPSTTGALTNANSRISYTGAWFDGIDRSIASANYGAIGSFTRPSTPPSSSSAVLVSGTVYDSAGRVYQTNDPKGIITQMAYDAAGRTTQVVEDQGGLNRTANTAYTLDNQVAALMAVNSTTGDQITAYVYGTTLDDSGVARNDLLRQTIYPDAARGWAELSVFDWGDLSLADWAGLPLDATGDVTTATYNRLGERTSFTDQRGTVRTFYYDKLGRQTNDCVTTNGTGTDVTVKQIATVYEVRGMPSTMTSYDSSTQNSGTVLNQVQRTYNTFGQLTEEQQSHSGVVGVSTPNVQYGYDTGGSSSNEIRLATVTYPNGRVITNNYASGMDSTLNRVTSISDTSATLASYAYLGLSTVVRITYPEPSVWLDLWGGTSGTFAGLDQFNRIIDQRWQNSITGTPTDIDRYQYGYDQNSNRLWKANVAGTAVVSVDGLDEYYTYDPLNRLTEMQRGVLTSIRSGITGTPVAEQDWTFDSTGNWSAYLTKTNGTTDLNQTRTANKVNEISDISGTPAWATPPSYDAAGNMTSFPQPASPSDSYAAVYDAWNRMTSISASGSAVATYQYDGRNFRIEKMTTATSEARQFYYTSKWQDIEERVGTSTTMDQQYVWGIRYVDELVCRDDDTANPARRLYGTQDANFNLTAITTSSGSVFEHYLFDPYAIRTVYTTSWSPMNSSVCGWTCGHQGLMVDFEIGLIYHRHRWLNGVLGRFLERDASGYTDGFNLYVYERDNPICYLDPEGSNAYGVYCGPGPAAFPPPPPPIDAVDSCCAAHDACYSACGVAGIWGVLQTGVCARSCDLQLCICVVFADCRWSVACNAFKYLVENIFCDNACRIGIGV